MNSLPSSDSNSAVSSPSMSKGSLEDTNDFAHKEDANSNVEGNAPRNDRGGGGSKGDDSGPLTDMPDYSDRGGQHHPIAEFLYQLTKMLTDDNTEVIEWSDGRIKVHHPERLEAEVLHKYFRHSKFASFQRQLNYFGFRKMAGKGKMSPCSYVNDAATSDIRSLLLIKRKTNGSASRKAAIHQRTIEQHMNPLLGMNLGSFASNAGMMNMNGINSAMALLSENALRAGLGQFPQNPNSISNTQLSLFALQQQQQQLQQQLQLQFSQNQSQEQLFLPGQQQFQQLAPSTASNAQQAPTLSSSGNMAQRKEGDGKAPTLEQLQAQLLASSGQHGNLTNGGLSFNQLSNLLRAPSGAPGANPASAALQEQNSSMPATAAMDAASATNQATNNLFESAINLKSLLQEHQESQNREGMASASGMNGAAQAYLNLPSSHAMFPSSTSFGNLLGSSNRLNSLLSLNSFGREQSLADFAAVSNMTAQIAASNNAAAQMNNGQNLRGSN